MRRDELKELQFIAPIDNLASLLERGILSHNAMKKVKHVSVAMQAVQDLRAKKVVPGGKALHDYANLYVCARNPMMFLRRGAHQELCVLSVSTGVLDVPGTVDSDQNASSNYVRFCCRAGWLGHSRPR